MNRKVVRYGRIGVLLATLVVSGLAACSENFDSSATCSEATGLCPGAVPGLRDTVLYPVVLDTTVGTYPPIGQEVELTLAARGDSLDTRVILRYDSLPTKFRVPKADSDSVIRAVKGSRLTLHLDPARMAPLTPTAPVRIDVFDVYDVNAPAVDTVASQLLGRFTPDRLLATRVVSPDSLKDSLTIALPDDSVAAHITSGTPLRLGLRVSSSESIQLEIKSLNASVAAPISFTPVSPDTTQGVTEIAQNSRAPADPAYLGVNLADFIVVARAPANPSNAVLQTGGVPAMRTYMRFDLPSGIVDSTTVVRAVLELTQRPNRSSPAAYDKDTLGVVPVLASRRVTDLYRAVAITGTISSDSVVVAPADSGLRSFEVVRLLHSWRGQADSITPRAVVVRTSSEGTSAGIIQFFSSSADMTVRPRLRLTYVPRAGFGLP